MELIVSGRQTGRTTRLMYACHEANMNGELAYMVVHSHREAYRIAKRAEEEGLIGFRFPLTFDEFLGSHGRPRISYYIDNADMLLAILANGPVVAASFEA